MSSTADEYETWFSQGNRDLAEFLAARDLSDDDFRDCLLTDLYLKHEASESLDVEAYVERLPRVAADKDLQVELWLEAFGYLEDTVDITETVVETFLVDVPEPIRNTVADRITAEQTSFQTAPPETPPVIPRYRVDKEIGRGSFGVVYQAWDKQLDRPVALKVLQASQSNDDLFAEARLVARLDVPGIVSVYDCGIEDGGRAFFVTSYLDGIDLRQWAASVNDDDWERICRLIVRLCKSLAVAHSAGIVHRDIKPGNIIVRDGDDPCLLDFGLALGGWKPGREGELVGTPAYMSPEQARGEGHLVDARSDIFSLGIVMMEVLSRKRPWESKSSRELIREISLGEVPSVRRLNASVPIALERICQKATAPAISQRYGEVSELVQDLQWYLNENPSAETDRRHESSAIASRGLRSYGADDAKAFWQLIPGQRNARGVPDSVRWWLESIAGTPGVHRGVLVLYGPSGSGKSSLLHAGVLPFLDSSEFQSVTLDASELSTPESMQKALLSTLVPKGQKPDAEGDQQYEKVPKGQKHPAGGQGHRDMDAEDQSKPRRGGSHTDYRPTGAEELAEQPPVGKPTGTELSSLRDWDADNSPEEPQTLTSFCSSLRENADRRTIIVLDQFEQVLAWNNEQQREQVALAMRQADGERLQFVLVVRDEFWSAISQWMRDLDAPLRDGRNAMGLERFSRKHASKVLQTWADAAGRAIPSDEFLAQALRIVSVDDRVVPVRLALLATVLGDSEWKLNRLHEISSRGSLSGYYLDSVLGELAPAASRQFTRSAQAVLRCLTPEAGPIRGPVRSAEELKEACREVGRSVTQSEFDDLVDLLDRQLHLITPTENAKQAGVHYQLPHDFLVPELRRWLDDSDQKTASGRAAVDLRRSSDRWNGDPHSRNLAGPVDCLRFGLITRPVDRQQRDFVRTSARKHLLRGVVIAAAAAILMASFQFVLLRSHGEAIVNRLVSSSIDQLPDAIAETRRNHYWTQRPLETRSAVSQREPDMVVRDRIALARLRDEPDQSNYLAQRLVDAEPPMRLLITQQMESDLSGDDRSAVSDHLAAVISDESQPGIARLNAAIGLGRLDPTHSVWDLVRDDLCQLLVEANPVDLGWLKDGLYPMRRRLTEGLTAIRTEDEPAKTRTATYLLAEFAADDERSLVELLEKSSLSQLSAIAPAVSHAEQSIVQVLKTRFADRVDALKKAVDTIESSDSESNSASRLAAMGSLRVTLSRQIGNLGSALIYRGEGAEVLPHLRMSHDPTIRNYLIECYVSSRGPAAPLARLLLDPSNDSPRLRDGIPPDVASSLLLALGSLPALSQVPADVRTLAVDIYRTTDDAQLQASAEWFLNKQGFSADIAGVKFNESVGYVTAHGQTMVRLPGELTAMVGSTTLDRNRLANEERHAVEIPHEIYFSRHELSVEKLQQFRQTQDIAAAPIARKSDGNTAVRIGFFEAAAYCNWLSEQEDVPEDQWCYVPREDGQYAPGMQIAEDHLHRSGYQIPTPDLWEYACRGGTTTPRPYGHGTELSSEFVRWMGTRAGTQQRNAYRKPNGFGLFDMLGNSSEWSVGLVDRSQMNSPDPRSRGPRVPMGEQRFPTGEPGGRFGGPRMQRPGLGPPPDIGEGPRQRPRGRPGLAFGGGPKLTDAAGETVRENSQFVILGGAFDSPAHKTRSSDRSIISPPYTNKPITLRLMRIVSWQE